jgi:hypothetical protein
MRWGPIVGYIAGILAGGIAGGLMGVITLLFVVGWTDYDNFLWLPYSFARMRLALGRQLPWRLLAFLRDAHVRGVLRQAGAVYQFRHAELQRRLAARARHESMGMARFLQTDPPAMPIVVEADRHDELALF